MAVDPRRDHSLRVPRPDLSVQIGTPNACSSCHVKDQRKDLDPDAKELVEGKQYQDWLLLAADEPSIQAAISKTDQWCNQACDKWYGAERKTPAHFAEVLHAMRSGEAKSIDQALEALDKPNELVPAIAKASMLAEFSMNPPNEQAADTALAIATDSTKEPTVRAAALTVPGIVASENTVRDRLLPLLEDPFRVVRNETTRLLVQSGAYEQVLTGAERVLVDKALESVKESLMTASDRSGAHIGWALLCEQTGRFRRSCERLRSSD